MKRITKKMSAVLAAMMVLALLAAIPASAFSLPNEDGWLRYSTIVSKKAKHYLVIGDSIAYGVGVANMEDASYARILSDTFKVNLVDDFYTGCTSSDLLKYSRRPSVKQDIKDADLISISIGGNDFFSADLQKLMSGVSSNDYSYFDKLNEKYEKNLNKIIQQFTKWNPDVTITLQTIYNFLDAPDTAAVKNLGEEMVGRLNETIRSTAGKYDNVELIELHHLFIGDRSLLAFDHIHPSAKGNVVIAKQMRKAINKIGIFGKAGKLVQNTKGHDQDVYYLTTEIVEILTSGQLTNGLSLNSLATVGETKEA